MWLTLRPADPQKGVHRNRPWLGNQHITLDGCTLHTRSSATCRDANRVRTRIDTEYVRNRHNLALSTWSAFALHIGSSLSQTQAKAGDLVTSADCGHSSVALHTAIVADTGCVSGTD